jgi:phage terminase small subunit
MGWPKGDDGFTYKQRLFVHYFLGDAHGNATEAARMAGYSNPEIGRQMLRNITIRAAIERKVTGAAMAADEVLARLSEHASADMGDLDGLLKFDGEGKLKLDLKGAKKRGKSRLIKKLRPTRDGIAVELVDSQAALVQLGRYHGLFIDRTEVSQAARRDVETLREHLKDDGDDDGPVEGG